MVRFNLTQAVFIKPVNDLSDERRSSVLGQGAEASGGENRFFPLGIRGTPAYRMGVGRGGVLLRSSAGFRLRGSLRLPPLLLEGEEGFSPFFIHLVYIF